MAANRGTQHQTRDKANCQNQTNEANSDLDVVVAGRVHLLLGDEVVAPLCAFALRFETHTGNNIRDTGNNAVSVGCVRSRRLSEQPASQPNAGLACMQGEAYAGRSVLSNTRANGEREAVELGRTLLETHDLARERGAAERDLRIVTQTQRKPEKPVESKWKVRVK